MKDVFRQLFTLLLLSMVSQIALSQNVDIDIKIKNYDNDTLIVGNHFADRQVVKDTLIRKNRKDNFELTADSLFEQGVYIIITMPDHQYVQFLIPEDDQEFDLELDYKDISILKCKDSDENELFAEYLDFLRKRRPENIKLQKELEEAKEGSDEEQKVKTKLSYLDQEILDYQHKVVDENPNTITALLIAANFQVDIPDFEGDEKDVKMQKFKFYRDHYFDNINFNHPAVLRTPFLDERITHYIENLTSPVPDSTIIAIDTILGKFTNNPEALQYYTSHFLNQYAKMKIVGQDAIYVHMVDKYYSKGKAPWVNEETLAKIVDNANKLRPLLIGNTLPDITTYDKDNQAIRIRDIDSKYTVLVFWAPNCGHCKKAMPFIVDFNDKYIDKGVKTISICTKGGEKYQGCWDGLEQKDMLRLLNTGDEHIRFQRKMFVRQTPKIIVLDENKEIIIKDIPAKNLEEIVDEIIRLDELQDNNINVKE